MSNFKEADPTLTIVDNDTFAQWLSGYGQSILKDPNSNSLNVDLTDKSQLEGFEYISIQQVPWAYIPPSLQEIIAMQYEAATQANGVRNVVIKLEENNITFTIESSLKKRDLDIYGESDVSGGLELSRDTSGKANWSIFKAPATLQPKLDRFNNMSITDNIDALIARARQAVEIVKIVDQATTEMDATLLQLHDVAKLLMKVRSHAIVTQLVVASS